MLFPRLRPGLRQPGGEVGVCPGAGQSGRRKFDSIVFYHDYLVRVKGGVRIDWARLGLAPPEALVATGYGKNLLKAHFPTITEIRAHFLGASFVTGLNHFILLEMGGRTPRSFISGRAGCSTSSPTTAAPRAPGATWKTWPGFSRCP